MQEQSVFEQNNLKEAQDTTADDTAVVTPTLEESAPTDASSPAQENGVFDVICPARDGVGIEAVPVVPEDSIGPQDIGREAQDGPERSIVETDGAVEDRPLSVEKQKDDSLVTTDEEMHEQVVSQQTSLKEDPDEETLAVSPAPDEPAPTDTSSQPEEVVVIDKISFAHGGMAIEAGAVVPQEDAVLQDNTGGEVEGRPEDITGEPDGPVENQPACVGNHNDSLAAIDEEMYEQSVSEQNKEAQHKTAEETVALDEPAPTDTSLPPEENRLVDEIFLAHDSMEEEAVAAIPQHTGGELQDSPGSSIGDGRVENQPALAEKHMDSLVPTDDEMPEQSVFKHISIKDTQDKTAEETVAVTQELDESTATDTSLPPQEIEVVHDIPLVQDGVGTEAVAVVLHGEVQDKPDSTTGEPVSAVENHPACVAEHWDLLVAKDEEMLVVEQNYVKEAQDSTAEEFEEKGCLVAADEEMQEQSVIEQNSVKEAQDTPAEEINHIDTFVGKDEEMQEQSVFEHDSLIGAQEITGKEIENQDSLVLTDKEMHEQSVFEHNSVKEDQDTAEETVAVTPAIDELAPIDTSLPPEENGVSDEISLAPGMGMEVVAVVSQVGAEAKPSAAKIKSAKHESRRTKTKKHRKRRHKNVEGKGKHTVDNKEDRVGNNKEDRVSLPDESEHVGVTPPLDVIMATEGSALTEDEGKVKTVGASVGSGSDLKPTVVTVVASGGSGSEVKVPVSVQTKRKGHRKRKRHRKQDDTDDGGKVSKKSKTDSAVPTTNAPPAESTSTPTAVAMSTRKITFKTRPRTPPKTPPEVARKTAPKTPPKSAPKSTRRSTTHRGGRRKKDDDGYAYFCALCQEFGKLLCCEKCKQAFHLACLGLDQEPDADPWMCDNCVENKVECFDCKEFTAIEEDVLLCSFKNCSKYFHEECSKKWDRWDRAQLAKTSASKKPNGFTCPHHICDACGNARTPKRSRLYRCLYCPVAYHENCAPDGTQFLEDVPGFMSCWKHDDDWKREIQTGEQIRDLKTFFQQLPLPGVSNDFQVPQFIHEAVKKLNRKPATYTHIRRNIYLAKKPRRRSEDEGMQCPCKPSDSSKSACDKDCLCGMLLTSCSTSCECGDSCKNVPFQKRPGQKLKAVKTQNCGWGLRADVDIRAGDFLIEYVGEVIDDKTCEERLWALKKQGETNFYMCEISREMVIDATFKGNLSRYINHSCEPNTELQKWNMEGEVRIGVFAISDIKKGDFITYDYQFIQFGTDQQCHCGSTVCRGQLGVRSQRPKDPSMSPRMSRPSRGSKFLDHSTNDSALQMQIGRVFRQRRDQCVDSAGTKDLQCVRYNSAEATKWVGHRVGVWWPLDQKYYRGQIVSYNATSKKHVITYDDGDLEDLNMSKETWLLETVPISHIQLGSKT